MTVLWYGFFCSLILSVNANAFFILHVWKKRKDGFFYIDQLGRMEFHLCHLIPEICWFLHDCVVFSISNCTFGMEIVGVHINFSRLYLHLQILVRISRNQRVAFLVMSFFPNVIGFSRKKRVAVIKASMFSHRIQSCSSVSDNHNFAAQQSPKSNYKYRAYGELSYLVYCFLQKIMKCVTLAVVEK